jgi:signal transduction histidine kinase
MVLYPVREPGGTLHGYIELSNGPAYGRDVLTSVIWGWAIASGVAVVLAAGTGWLISRRLSAPLLALTITTARMAAGDLSTRTSIRRDDEVGTLAQTFNEMADQVEETVVALRRFVADAAHELNTPLTALRTNLELSLHESELPSQTAFLERAQLQVVRLENLTGDLLDLSRLEANADRTGQQAVDLSSLLRAATEPYASRAEQANLNFQLIQPTSAVIIHGDEDQLRRALSNLLDNALKFTPEGGRITVGLQVNDQTAQVWIEDTGIGIPPEDLPQLFSRFHRGRNTAAYPGSGLGLAIVKAIADHHQGRVEVVSTPGGTRFNLWLPS